MITLHHPTMIEDDIKEKVFVLLVMVLIGLSFALHIPKMIQTWNDTKYIKTVGMMKVGYHHHRFYYLLTFK